MEHDEITLTEENSLDLEWLCSSLHEVERRIEYYSKQKEDIRSHIQKALDLKGYKKFEHGDFSYKQVETTNRDCSQLYPYFSELGKLDLFVDAPKISYAKLRKLFDEGNITAVEYEAANKLITEKFETTLRVERIKK